MKHPVLGNRVRLIIWWLAWLLLSLGQALLFYYAFGSYTNISILDSIASLIIFSGIALSLWYPFDFFNKSGARPSSVFMNLVLTGAVSVTLWIFITKMIMILMFPQENIYQQYWDATFPYRIGIGVIIYTMIILTYFLFESLTNLSEKSAREANLESLVKETELKMLRSQINPHFLFNSLNSISSLTVTDPEKARSMVVKLSDFMRYALSRKDEQPVSFRSELDNLRLYLDIEKVRFGDRLSTEEHIEGITLEAKIPIMLLQPLYENAVKHGVYESTGCVRIVTTAAVSEGILAITISNSFENGVSSAKGTGTGLLNVIRRLELTYSNKASLRTEKKDGVFTVNLFLPAEFV
jgi:two-component system, LytTR family, sensor kinase